MAGMYDPFAHITSDPWWRLNKRVRDDGFKAGVSMQDAMRDPALDDEWPEWSVDW